MWKIPGGETNNTLNVEIGLCLSLFYSRSKLNQFLWMIWGQITTIWGTSVVWGPYNLTRANVTSHFSHSWGTSGSLFKRQPEQLLEDASKSEVFFFPIPDPESLWILVIYIYILTQTTNFLHINMWVLTKSFINLVATIPWHEPRNPGQWRDVGSMVCPNSRDHYITNP